MDLDDSVTSVTEVSSGWSAASVDPPNQGIKNTFYLYIINLIKII